MTAPTHYSLSCNYSLTSRADGQILSSGQTTINQPGACPSQPLQACWGQLGNSIGQFSQAINANNSPFTVSFSSECGNYCPANTTLDPTTQLCMPNQ